MRRQAGSRSHSRARRAGSGLNWFLLSLLGGPIATFVLVAFYEPLKRR